MASHPHPHPHPHPLPHMRIHILSVSLMTEPRQRRPRGVFLGHKTSQAQCSSVVCVELPPKKKMYPRTRLCVYRCTNADRTPDNSARRQVRTQAKTTTCPSAKMKMGTSSSNKSHPPSLPISVPDGEHAPPPKAPAVPQAGYRRSPTPATCRARHRHQARDFFRDFLSPQHATRRA